MQKYGTPEPIEPERPENQGVDVERTDKLAGLYTPQEIIEEEAMADREIADRD
jgi:hypothetical protein